MKVRPTLPPSCAKRGQSGKDFERPAYKRLLKILKPGDTLVIKSIDRLAGIIMRFWSNGELSQRATVRHRVLDAD